MSKNIVLDDIFDIEDYLDELEEKIPEVHSGTLRIEELSDINTRAAHLVPEYQPTTSGISLQNLIDIKENTIDKDPTPTPEEDIVIKFLYANPWCLGFDKEFEPNPEYWTDTTESGDKWHSWIPKDENISYTYAGHKFTGEDVPIHWEDGATIFEIEIEPNAIDREGITDSIIKLPINISFPEGAFINGNKKTKAVNYSFNFTDDLNGGDYPLKAQTIDTSDPTVVITEDFVYTNYGLPSSSPFNKEYWESIYELIENEVFTTIILNDSGESKTYSIDKEGGSIGFEALLIDEEGNDCGMVSCIAGDPSSSKGFITRIYLETESK